MTSRRRDDDDPLYDIQFDRPHENYNSDQPDYDYPGRLYGCWTHEVRPIGIAYENDGFGCHVYVISTEEDHIYAVLSDRIKDNEVADDDRVDARIADDAAYGVAFTWMHRHPDPTIHKQNGGRP